MNSIYHFYKSLILNEKAFFKIAKLEDFPFDKTLLASENRGKFPDLSIKLNANQSIFTGGEFNRAKR